MQGRHGRYPKSCRPSRRARVEAMNVETFTPREESHIEKPSGSLRRSPWETRVQLCEEPQSPAGNSSRSEPTRTYNNEVTDSPLSSSTPRIIAQLTGRPRGRHRRRPRGPDGGLPAGEAGPVPRHGARGRRHGRRHLADGAVQGLPLRHRRPPLLHEDRAGRRSCGTRSSATSSSRCRGCRAFTTTASSSTIR